MPSIPPAGLSALASFVTVEQVEQAKPPAILADDVDAKTGQLRSLLRGVSIADGMVIHLLRTQRGSGAAVREFGQTWREITHVDDRSPEDLRSRTRAALKPAKEAGVLRFTDISAEVDAIDPAQINHRVEYTDLLAPPAKARRVLTIDERRLRR